MKKQTSAGGAVLLAMVMGADAFAVSVEDYKKYPVGEQAGYVSGAIRMMAYYQGGEKAKCINDWYDNNIESSADVVIMLGTVQEKDARGLQVEGLLMRLIERHCGPLGQKSGDKK